MRKSSIVRNTKETKIDLTLNIDGASKSSIDTGIPFLDHMLNLMIFHGNFDLDLKCDGDLEIDTHHTVEDIGIALGLAFKEALGEKVGINRYGSSRVVMDEALASVDLDISGRSYLVFNCDFKREFLGTMETENFLEFFRALSSNMDLTLHINLIYGENDHHKIEAIFKALGRALNIATDITSDRVMSSKGVL